MSMMLLFGGDVSPAYSLNFLGGMPSGLTYTNSSTSRYYWNASGNLVTAAANEPIFEHDPLTLSLRGMRWEMEQRTNLNPYSSEDDAAWGVVNTTKASALSVVPTKSATLCTTTAAGGFIAQTVSTFSGSTESAWAIIEQGTGAESNLLVYNSTALSVVANARLIWSTMSASLAGGTGTVSVSLLKNTGPNGGKLALLSVSYTGTAGNSRSIRYYPAGAGSGTGYRHHTQIEAGASNSSIIVTGAASVTRQPDVLTASSISPWYNQGEGTVVFEGIASTPATAQRGMYLFSDGTDNERISGYRASGLNGGVLVVDGGVTQADISSLSAIAQASIFRHALAYKLNDVAGSVNGGTPVVDTSATMPTITGLTLGQGNTAGTQAFMGYARRFQYYNRRLPDAMIKGMSRV